MATEAPPTPPVVTAPPQAGDETSKSIFAQEMAKVAEPATEPPAAPEPPVTPPAEPPPAAADTDDKSKVENRDSKIPADVLDPDATPAPKVSDAIAELESLVLPKNAKPEQVASFGKLKELAKKHITAAETRISEIEKEIEKKGQSTAELEELQRKLQEASAARTEIEEQFAKVAFKESPKFKAQFADREQTALDLAKSYLDGTEIKADIIDLAAHATGRKRIEVLQDAKLDPETISAILPHLANFDTIQREKQAALNNWQATSKQEREQAQQEAARLAAQRAEQENKVWDQVVSKLDILPLRKSKDNAEWNQRAEQIAAEAKAIFNGDGADLPKFAETIIKGRAYDVQQEVLDHLRTENATLRTENAALKSAAPGGQITVGTKDGAPVDASKMSREDLAKATFNAEKARVSAA